MKTNPTTPAPSNDRMVATSLPLSRAKLAPPRLPGHIVAVDRQRQWIEQILLHDVTLILAPGDYGKSILCASLYGHLRGLGHCCGWVSMDSDLSSAAAGDYIIASITEMVGGNGNPSFCAGNRPPAEEAAVRLANAIQAQSDPVILFLDDVDRIRDGWSIALLDQLMQQRCINLHLVLTSSGHPPAFARRAEQRADALKLDSDDLRLSDLEVAELLATSGVFLGDTQVADLNAVMAGWTGGLKIVAGTLRQMATETVGDDWEEHCCGALGPYFDFALDAQPSTRRSFLLRCAVAKELTPGLCAALTGEENAVTLLRDLAESGLLVQRLRGALDRYRFHPVFRAFLVRRLMALEPAQTPELFRRASAWHAAQGMINDAIMFALEGRDTETAAELLAGEAMAMIERAGPVDIGEMIGKLPLAAVAGRPALLRAAAWATALRADPVGTGVLRSHVPDVEVGAIEAVGAIIQQDRLVKGLELANAFLTDHGDDHGFGARMVRSLAALAETQQGRHRQASELLRPIVARTRTDDGGLPEAVGYFVIAAMHRAQGRPADAERALRDAARRIDRAEDGRSTAAALLAVALSRSLYERNDMASAACLIDGRIPVLEQAGIADATIQAYVVAIRVAVSLGRIDEAVALIDRAELVAFDRRWLPMQAMCAVERWRLHLPTLTSLDEIVPIGAEEQAVEQPLSAEARAFAILSEARAYEAIAHDDRPRLTTVAERLLRLSETANDVALRVRATLFNVLPQLSGRCGRMVEIDTAKFLNQAAGLGYIRTIVDILEVTGVRTSQDFCSSDYSAGSFLAMLRLAQPPSSEAWAGSHDAPSGEAFSFLSTREIEIVNALHGGETNKLIARKLGLTPETIKWHLKNLMKKLRANSRNEVVCNAAALGLSFSAPEQGF